MAFSTSFSRTSARAEPSVASTLYLAAPSTGVYSNGLLTVVESSLSAHLAEQWHWLLGSDFRPLAYTAFGDFFFKSESHGAVFFIEVQRGRSMLVDKSPEIVFERFLCEVGAKQNVLQQQRVQELAARLGPLAYGSCFIAEPWESLGGSVAIDSFKVGEVVVYNGLVAQTVKRALDARRQAQQGIQLDGPASGGSAS